VGKNPDMLDCKEKNVFYLGLLGPDELLRAIQKSKLIVLPSRTEGLPLSILEAMSCNKPVLVSPVGELVSVINDSWNGFFLKEFSAKSLGRQLLHIINNYSNTKAVIGDNPRKSVLKFDIRKITELHWDLYQKLTSSGSR
jgi:glycosyltransferase involved in cell wall biosynthesis